ncbi:Glyoxalase-like domain-containing protein [Cohaesibacter sp. ES.047]|uniref:VOC family protein n=1 Tax=Cohaesibacter sp. ES.047 TaxID=1798205 RepID=UPI000BB96C12|nr:VOC family protein [Cohaesibacter sp. ES.047]SNY93941.1 Glyoxalase-like domain-containing protein [Cohaesibacter sp. ES.047]
MTEQPNRAAPPIKGVLETPVYVDDLDEAHGFYNGLLGFERMIKGPRICAYNVAPSQILIVCLRGACDADSEIGGAVVPGHRMDGIGHFAFRISARDIDGWQAYLEAKGINIVSRANWPLGGESFYFRDPFGNVVELATGNVWPNDRDAD